MPNPLPVDRQAIAEAFADPRMQRAFEMLLQAVLGGGFPDPATMIHATDYADAISKGVPDWGWYLNGWVPQIAVPP